MKKKYYGFLVASLFISSFGISLAQGAYLVEEDDYIVWKVSPVDQDPFYLKVKVDQNTYPLDLTALIYDPSEDTTTEQESWALTTRNYIYNETQLAWITSTKENETVSRQYGGKKVTCEKITWDSDNIYYFDKATGVMCEGDVDVGSVKYSLILVNWTNADMSQYANPASNGGDDFAIPGFLPFSLFACVLGSVYLILKKRNC